MRPTGFYWVMYFGVGQPAKYDANNRQWFIIGYDGPVSEDCFKWIGDKLT